MRCSRSIFKTQFACCLFLFVFVFQGSAAAGIVASFTINGIDVNQAVNSQNTLILKVGEIANFKYTGGYSSCTDVEWYITPQGGAVNNFSHNETGSLKFMYVGKYTLKMTADGFTNYFNCWRGNEYAERSITISVVGNNYPIVLVHGFIGWGRSEFSLPGMHLYYWGHRSGDLEAEMIARGFDVYTASVSPLGSAWDRACELYAQLKGGTRVDKSGEKGTIDYVEMPGKYYVDYGAAHAQGVTDRAGADPSLKQNIDGKEINRGTHSRFGNPLLAHQWGMTNSKGEYFTQKHPRFPSEPIHLVVHSYGGQTSKVFMELMKNGSPQKGREGSTAIPESPLFTGGHSNFVRSLTTIASPHNGTDLTYVADDLFPTMGDLLGYFLGSEVDLVEWLTNGTIQSLLGSFYGLDVDQWEYSLPFDAIDIQAVGGQMLYLDGDGNLIPELQPTIKDISLWDLSPAGSKEINKWCPTSHFANESYFFTYNCEQTFMSGGGSIGQKGWWYFENSLLRTPTWNIEPGTNQGGTMCLLTELVADAMGSGTYTTGLSVTKKSLSLIPKIQGTTGYVPADLVRIISSEIDVSPKPCEILRDYFGNSQDLSEGWKFADRPNTGVTKEAQLRNKLVALYNRKGIAQAYYSPYLDNIMSYGALQLDLTSQWRENDGVVNTNASIAPWGDTFVDGTPSSQFITPHPTPNYAPQTGKWVYLDLMRGDHFDIIGGQDFKIGREKVWGDHTASSSNPVDIFDFYETHFLRLWRLPSF